MFLISSILLIFFNCTFRSLRCFHLFLILFEGLCGSWLAWALQCSWKGPGVLGLPLVLVFLLQLCTLFVSLLPLSKLLCKYSQIVWNYYLHSFGNFNSTVIRTSGQVNPNLKFVFAPCCSLKCLLKHMRIEYDGWPPICSSWFNFNGTELIASKRTYLNPCSFFIFYILSHGLWTNLWVTDFLFTE